MELISQKVNDTEYLTQSLTISKRYQLYTVSSKKVKMSQMPIVSLDAHNILGEKWPILAVSVYNATREATSVYYVPYCGLKL